MDTKKKSLQARKENRTLTYYFSQKKKAKTKVEKSCFKKEKT